MATTNDKKRTPKQLWEVSRLMLKLTQNIFASMRIEHSHKVKVARMEKEMKEKLGERNRAKEELISQIHSLMNMKRGEVEKSGAKSVTLATGQVGWRMTPPSVKFAEGMTEKSVIAKLLKRGKKYLRFKPEINKEKIIQDYNDGSWKDQSGIKVGQFEEFYISPAPRGKEKPKIITISEE